MTDPFPSTTSPGTQRPAARRAAALRARHAQGRIGASLPTAGVPEADPASEIPGRAAARRDRRAAEPLRARGDAPLRAPVAVELRHRLGPVPARLVHDEVQPQVERGHRAAAGLRAGASHAAGRASAQGALQLGYELERALSEISGFAACTLQPAAGAQGELCGLLMIRGLPHRSAATRARRCSSRTAPTAPTPRAARWPATRSCRIKSGRDGVIAPATVAAALDARDVGGA